MSHKEHVQVTGKNDSTIDVSNRTSAKYRKSIITLAHGIRVLRDRGVAPVISHTNLITVFARSKPELQRKDYRVA